MGKKNIEKYTLFYQLLRTYVDFWHNNIYYRKVIAYGKDSIDFSIPTILAPNHQNALMDAMAVICTLKRQLVFLARADIFKNKLVARLLYLLKMLPVFRIRDGYETLKHNDETFQNTLRVLRHLNGLVILPEGTHAEYRRLRQLKKGICRIAFLAAEASDFREKINIVPVGIEYSHYWLFREVLTVVYGHPIDVSAYYDAYRENPNKAMLDLRDRLSAEMIKVMIHIENQEDYEALDELRSIINSKYSDRIRYPKLFRDQRLISKVNSVREADPEEYRKICDESLKVRDLSSKLRLTYRLLGRKRHPFGWLVASLLLLLVTFPVFLTGALLSFPLFKIPEVQSMKVKDKAFISTSRYGFTLGLSFIMGPLYLALALIFIKPWWLALAAFMSIPLAGVLAWNLYMLFRRTMGGFRIRKLMRQSNPEYLLLRKTYDSLRARIAKL